MHYVRRLPCAARDLGACDGRVEADHQGRRGAGQKSSDHETVPLCSRHHREREAFAGAFRNFDQEAMRAWMRSCLDKTRDQVWSIVRGEMKLHVDDIKRWMDGDALAKVLSDMSARMYSLAQGHSDGPTAMLMRNFAGELGTAAMAASSVIAYAKDQEAEAMRVKTIAVRELHKEYLERTPLGTQLAYVHEGEVVVIGYPKEGDDHNCDQMGCGSLDHVVRRMPLGEAAP